MENTAQRAQFAHIAAMARRRVIQEKENAQFEINQLKKAFAAVMGAGFYDVFDEKGQRIGYIVVDETGFFDVNQFGDQENTLERSLEFLHLAFKGYKEKI